MEMKKFLAAMLSMAMITSSAAALAAAPSAYDGQPYESLGYTSDDPDGVFNLAVIAKDTVDIVGDGMLIEGSVYTDGTIYVGDGEGNTVNGLFISGVEGMTDYNTTGGDAEDTLRAGYIHVNDNHEEVTNAYSVTLNYEGAIYDTETSFDCAYDAFEIPSIANDLKVDNYSSADVEMNVYGQDYTQWGATANSTPKTITEDTHIGKLHMVGSDMPAMTIDTTDGDVTVVIDEFTSGSRNLNVKVVGDNRANIYVGNYSSNAGLNFVLNAKVDYSTWPTTIVPDGSVDNTYLYITGDNVNLDASRIFANTIAVNTNELTVSGSSYIDADIESGADAFAITGGSTEVYGVVCVPNADSKVIDNGTLYGQLHTKTLAMNGWGRIIYGKDSAVAKSEKDPEPTEEPITIVPSGEEVDLTGLGYAYIFGYEPGAPDENGFTPIYMAPNDNVTREQVAAMLMRMVDQTSAAKSAKYTITPNIEAWKGQWFSRGFAYLAGKGAFDGIDYVGMGAITRGEVAKLVAYGMNLSASQETPFADIADSEYKKYIEIMYAYGYMSGTSDNGFEPNRVMTRAEFCKMFNNIIDRENCSLTTADGHQVTAADYSIVDIDGHWAESTMLKATSAYDADGNVDFQIRQDNIRNKLDNYNSQLQY